MLLPTADKIKIHVSKDQFGLNAGSGSEHGVVVSVPSKEDIIFFGYHSFAFDNSLCNEELAEKLYNHFNKFMGKIVFWEALQDRGRRFQDGEDEYVFLNMSDIIAYEENDETQAYLIDDIRSGGFNVGK